MPNIFSKSTHPQSRPASPRPPSATTGTRSDIKANTRGLLDLAKAAATGIGTPTGLEPALNGIIQVWDMMENMKNNKEDLRELQTRLQILTNDLCFDNTTTQPSDSLRLRTEALSQKFSALSAECASIDGKSRLNRFLQAGMRKGMIASIKQNVRDAIQEFSIYNGITLEMMVKDLQKQNSSIHAVVTAQIVRNLKHAPARFDAANTPSPCLPGTREEFLRDILERAVGSIDADKRFIWIYGGPGMGKSTIAKSLAIELDKRNMLAASFFFSRDDEARKNFTDVFRTVARQMAHFSPAFHEALKRILEQDDQLAYAHPAIQLEKLVIDPMASLSRPDALWVLVFDALDECTDSGGAALLKSLCEHTAKLPIHVRIIFTSRPEHPIRIAFQHETFIPITHAISLHNIDKDIVSNDILSYFRDKLSGKGRPPGVEWSATDEELRILSSRAERLFIFASKSVKFIFRNGLVPKRRLQELLQLNSQSGSEHLLHKLYSTALGDVLNEDLGEKYRAIMGALVHVQEPVNTVMLSTLLAIDYDEVEAMLDALSALLILPEQRNGVVRIAHLSIIEYLTNPKTQPGLCLESEVCHEYLLDHCLQVMKKQLKFNICGLESSYCRNDEVPNLSIRISECITASLLYTCRFWAAHLQHTKSSNKQRVQSLVHFLETKFLWWLEVMSLLKHVSEAISDLLALANWSKDSNSYLSNIAHDTANFVRFFNIPIAQSTPHIYISGVPFSPSQSWIMRKYRHQYCDTISIISGEDKVWPAIQLVVAHPLGVNSVAFSPDGKHIVSGSNDNTLRLCNVQTGEATLQPFKGHTFPVTSVAFSPDGKYIVSGSWDKTVRLWNAETGEPILQPFEGHTWTVTSVAFSPDGKYIVSGSWDKTVRLWNVETGESILQPFEGHTDGVTSVAFSPDGKHIVSGSDDETVRLWNVETGESILQPFEGHTNFVTSVAFSPDGKHIVSGSDDKTVRLWNVETGESILQPFEGHSSYVTSVAFSPDGKHIVSGSWDKTVRIWNAETGESILHQFEGHTNFVTSVAFSPDGKHIVSGSEDKTVRLWNAETGKSIVHPFKGHTESVTSVAFSPDGKHIVSGSQDNTVRIWNADNQQSGLLSFKEHSKSTALIASSANGKHITSGSSDIMEHSRSHQKTGKLPGFTDHSHITDDGWVLNDDSTLLFWVPPSHRVALYRPSNTVVIGRGAMKLDLQRFVHGTDWHRVFKGNDNDM